MRGEGEIGKQISRLTQLQNPALSMASRVFLPHLLIVVFYHIPVNVIWARCLFYVVWFLIATIRVTGMWYMIKSTSSHSQGWRLAWLKWRTQIAKWGTGSWRGILESRDLICMWGRALAKVTNKSFENWPLNSDLLIIQQACLPPINRLVDKRELGSLKADLGVSGLTWNFSPIRSLPSASNTLFIVPFSLGLSLNS